MGGSDFDAADLVRKLALTLVPMILSLSFLECAHAFAAFKLGDKTAKDAGRLTLNPQVHIDPIGTLLIPAMSVLFGGVACIGWAKPTPFRADRMNKGVNRRLGAAIVSAAGPASNLLLACVSLALLSGLAHGGYFETESTSREAILTLLEAMIGLNVGLAIFNLLPIPPLDGHRLLPPAFDRIMAPLQKYGFGILMLIFFFLPSVANVIFYQPYKWTLHSLEHLFGIMT